MATKVHLREKSISGKRKSLYLDFYPPYEDPETGKIKRREFLGIYIIEKPKHVIDKQDRKEKLLQAEAIRSKRENELNKQDIYTPLEKEQIQINKYKEKDFIEYFKELTNKRKNSNHSNWLSSLKYLIQFTEGKLTFGEVDVVFCNDFKEYLLNTKNLRSNKTQLSQNSAHSYFNKFKAALKQAFQDGIIQIDLSAKVKPIKPEETRREFLTIDELIRLKDTPCNDELLKRAALFSALTGLRFSDIEKLQWKQLEYVDGDDPGYVLKFRQKKTKGIEVHPISKQAVKLMGAEKDLDDKVFEGMRYSAYHNKHIYQWIGAAGITKKITFHCFRHTYAVLQLANGTDIFTVSKMLGHRELKTTQIYTKVLDKAKREAADKIKLDF